MILEKKQFQELVLRFELTELPFLLVVKPPQGANSVEEALPEGFKERVQEKGLILDCWVPQLEILSHKSVGCFVIHCGWRLGVEVEKDENDLFTKENFCKAVKCVMDKDSQIGCDHRKWKELLSSTGFMTNYIDNFVDNLHALLRGSQIGRLVKENHKKWKEFLSSPGFMSNYIDNFIQDLHGLLVEKTR
ncbi:hypothetical protein H5410_024390 [Solanum commersonii]|uniref:Uncharacterized protein n=1 Tax=Solanum commersonii TaxID=4109 RepID=A0A9J5ZLT7_SOLCO|nr:hypothetical protein H5410_024390 [Solanum commersonii]